MRKISLPMKRKKKSRATTKSTHAADTFGFFSMMMGLFHSSPSVPMYGDSRSSSSYGQTAPGYYSSYSHTSGGSVSFPSLGGIFSLVPRASPSDQSLSSSDDIYTSNTNTSIPPSTSNTSSSNSSSTYTPPELHWVSLCRLCEKICLLIPSSLFYLIYLASPLIMMHEYFI